MRVSALANKISPFRHIREIVKSKSSVFLITLNFFPNKEGLVTLIAKRLITTWSLEWRTEFKRFSESKFTLKILFKPNITMMIPNTPKG